MEEKLTICTANIYELQERFNNGAVKIMDNLNIDKEVFAELCLCWVREHAKWDEHENTSDRLKEE